ncbi:hypothetical protein [Methylorubrum zatmanii]|uniref:DUF4332 domain-containing protein n=1 Tax=Methylorubrum zatmanii TaxID=29429 RepID=A0ABW1WNN4_9HYPH|nr:hypothetical protein [Methylorubrum zatmanii]MBD8906040.1 hypothetical protein [Methylorubrum zatmanii]
MNVYPLPAEFRRSWCLVPGILSDQVIDLTDVPPSGTFTKPALVAEMASSGVHTLADLALCLPEEVLSLPGVKLTTLLNLQAEILERLDTGPLVRDLSKTETEALSTITLYGLNLPTGVFVRAKALGIETLAGLAMTASPATLLARGLPLWKVRACRETIQAHLDRPSEAEALRVYAKRPLPPGFAEMTIKDSRLMLSWVGNVLVKERCTTFGKALKAVPTLAEIEKDWGNWEVWEFRAKAFHLAVAGRRMIAGLPQGDALYRIPYQDGIPPNRPPLFGDLTGDERAFLDRARSNPRDDLSTVQELAYENAPYDPDHHEAPEWIGAAWNYGMDALGFIADADLPYLFEAAGGRKDVVCDMLISVRRALLDHAELGSAEAVYGPEHAYLRFFRTFPKAA